jgi:hypothetical protein
MYAQLLKGKCEPVKYKKYRNLLTRLLRLAKKNYYTNFIASHKKDSRAMWTFINTHLGRNTSTKSSLPNIHADVLNNFFAEAGPNAVKHLSLNDNYQTYMSNKIPDSMFLAPVCDKELINCVRALHPKHSASFDDLSVYSLKRIINHIAVPLTQIFNKSFQSGIVPDFCKIARVVPIYKSGDSSDYTNYRPISILPALSKILEKLMHARLTNFLTKYNVLDDSQHGFRPKYSTCTALTEVLDFITKTVDHKKLCVSLFLDPNGQMEVCNVPARTGGML